MADLSPRILVVDDVAANRRLYAGWLAEIGGVAVAEAADGTEALALARAHDFALFVLDINMPGMDGFELASLLRQEPRAEGTPIMFVTADATPRTHLMRGYRMGAVDFMVWGPLEAEILQQKARVFIQLYRKRQELQQIVNQVRRENRQLQTRLADVASQQEVLLQQATHDVLTQLPNRALFEDRVTAAIHRAQRNRQRIALAYIDLDAFKPVNDRHGHATGDALLVSIAQRLQRAMRATDTVARLGGDEFGLLFESLDSPAGAEYVAAKAHRIIVEPVSLHSETDQAPVEVRVGASIGVALYPDHAITRADLLMLADMAMYAAKREGGGVRMHRPGAAPELAPDVAARGTEPTRLQLVRQRRE